MLRLRVMTSAGQVELAGMKDQVTRGRCSVATSTALVYWHIADELKLTIG
jgi:hypothetical protein